MFSNKSRFTVLRFDSPLIPIPQFQISIKSSCMKSGRPPVPAIGVAVQVVEEGADEVLHAVAGCVVEGRVVRVVFPVTEFD